MKAFKRNPRLTFKFVPFINGRKVSSISSISAGWKKRRAESAIYPMYAGNWLNAEKYILISYGMTLKTNMKLERT